MRKKEPKHADFEVPRVHTPDEIAQIRQDLQKLVEHRKKIEAAGKAKPSETHEELVAAMNASQNILSMGDVMREILPKMKEQEQKAAAFAASVKEKINGVESRFCEDHDQQELEIDVDATIGHSWKHNAFTVVTKECPVCRRVKQAIAKSSYWLDRGIPRTVLDATLVNYNTTGSEEKARVVKKFRKQIEKGSGFIFAVGTYGAGKSHLAAATIKEAGDGLFVTMHDLVGELRQTYEDGGQDDLVEKYRKAKVLVIDELSLEVYDPSRKKGLDIPALLYRVLGYRYEQGLLTVITSNETIEACMSILGPKLRDRMHTNYTIANFTWNSHRQKDKNP